MRASFFQALASRVDLTSRQVVTRAHMHLCNKVFSSLGWFSFEQIQDPLNHSVLKYEFV